MSLVRRVLWVALALAAVLAAAVASFMVSAAWSHNPQNEFHGPGSEINWQGLGFIWGAWFVVTMAVLSAVSGAVALLIQLVEKRLGQR